MCTMFSPHASYQSEAPYQFETPIFNNSKIQLQVFSNFPETHSSPPLKRQKYEEEQILQIQFSAFEKLKQFESLGESCVVCQRFTKKCKNVTKYLITPENKKEYEKIAGKKLESGRMCCWCYKNFSKLKRGQSNSTQDSSSKPQKHIPTKNQRCVVCNRITYNTKNPEKYIVNSTNIKQLEKFFKTSLVEGRLCYR